MSPWIIVLLVLLGVSIMCPIYTYAIYPIILKLLPRKQYTRAEYEPIVSVVILGSGERQIASKIENLKAMDYPAEKFEVLEACITGDKTKATSINEAVAKAKGVIVVFTDTESELEFHSIALLLQNFSDSRVGVACGMLKKRTGDEGAYWKYENLVKRQESKIGRLSGANKVLFGIRKEAVAELADNCINTDFCLATAALQDGWDAVFDDRAIAYEAEGNTDEKAFQRYVIEGAGYYQALTYFWRLLLPRKGSFVYCSHRVMKWLVPWNILVALVCSGMLGLLFTWAVVLLGVQAVGYATLYLYGLLNKKGKAIGGTPGKLLDIAYYFLTLNTCYLVGALGMKKYRKLQEGNP
jgi:hypothetical protein